MFAAHIMITSLHLTSASGITLTAGDALVLTCQSGADSNQTAYFDVKWRLNGTISSNYSGTTSYSNNYKHYLVVDPVFSNYFGTYTCELRDDAQVKESLDITVNPGTSDYKSFCI